MNYLTRFGQWYAICTVMAIGLFPIVALPPAGEARVGIPHRWSYVVAIASFYCAWTILARKRFAKTVIPLWGIWAIVLSPWKDFFHLGRSYFYIFIILVIGLGLWFLSPVFGRLFEQPITGDRPS